MTISAATRATIRAAYDHRCGYCGVREIWVGNALEIDHFRPISHDGADELDNLVYAWTACNRFKGDYWPTHTTPESFRLLHPLRDNLTLHIDQASSGRLVGLTSRGWFHINWLHLNRELLIQLRRWQQEERVFHTALAQAQTIKHSLQQRIVELEEEVNRLQALIDRLA
ncbi:MAG: HNH endonuclease [Chloroflexota bacterium]|nr:HNH endonuclease [Chloroflexota bacterium]